MIDTIIFDLDGTLVQTEKLKAISYAKAVVELCPKTLKEDVVVEAFKDMAGLSKQEVATSLMIHFGLEEKAAARMDEFGVDTAWQSFVRIRLDFYHKMLEDPQVIRSNQWPHAISLLKAANERSCKLGLATMSYCKQVRKILGALELNNTFDFVASREDVQKPKPNSEIYNLVMAELDSSPETTLIIEDSPAGVEAALRSQAEVIAVATPFTAERLQTIKALPKDRLVSDPARLMEVVQQVFARTARAYNDYKVENHKIFVA